MKKQLKDILKKGKYTVNGSLWIEGNGTRFFGPGPVELLQHIAVNTFTTSVAHKTRFATTKDRYSQRGNSMTDNSIT